MSTHSENCNVNRLRDTHDIEASGGCNCGYEHPIIDALLCAAKEEIEALQAELESEHNAVIFEQTRREQAERCLAARDAELQEERAQADGDRLNWLEGEMQVELAALEARRKCPDSLFRQSKPITRASIDAARAEKS